MRNSQHVGSRLRISGLVKKGVASLVAAGVMLGWSPATLRAQSENAESDCRKDSYSNENFLFSIALPTGLSCCHNLPPSPVHGCRITPLGKKGTELWVDGSYNALDYNSPDEAVYSAVGDYLVTGTVLTVLRREPTTLGGFDAVRLTLRIRKQGEAAAKIEDRVVAIAPRGGGSEDVVYTIGFRGSEAEYAKYEKTFSKIVSSWHALKEEAH